VAWGCGGCLVVVALLAGLVFLLGYQTCRRFQAGLEDPDVMAAAARDALGTERLPEGYRPVLALSMPLDLFTLLILADRPLVDQRLAPDTERVFVWVDAVRGPAGGGRDPESMLSDQGIRARSGARLGTGTLDVAGARVDWEARVGSLDADGARVEGILTILTVHCPGDRRLRNGLWMVAAPELAEEPQQADLAGTNADPERIREFLAPFRPCGAQSSP